MTHIPIGTRMPMHHSATGRAYLAFCVREHGETLQELIAKTPDLDREIMTRDNRALADVLPEVRKLGYAVVEGTHNVTNIGVPVLFKGNAVAGIALRFFTRSLKVAEVIKKHLKDLQETAAAIGADLERYDAKRDGATAK
jgi:IclR family mhp operon transcriptional activator